MHETNKSMRPHLLCILSASAVGYPSLLRLLHNHFLCRSGCRLHFLATQSLSVDNKKCLRNSASVTAAGGARKIGINFVYISFCHLSPNPRDFHYKFCWGGCELHANRFAGHMTLLRVARLPLIETLPISPSFRRNCRR